jgi:hypothetical protein
MAQDAALRDRVAQLVGKLQVADMADRDAAEKALGLLGPSALRLLPAELPAKADADAVTRLARVRGVMEESAEKGLLEASRVTIKGESIRMSDALRELQRQTGNTLTDLREQFGGETTNPAMDLDIDNKTFFEALLEIARKGEFGLTFSTGDGSIGLIPAGGMYGRQVEAADRTKAAEPLVKLVGPFRVELKQLSLARDLATNQSRGNALFEVAWEPRLRPMLLALKAEDIEIFDDLDQKVLPEVADESTSTVLRPENPAADVYLNMSAPDRKAQLFKTLKVKSTVTLPAGLKQFRFARLDQSDVALQQGDVKVTLQSTNVDDSVWSVQVLLEMPEGGPAFESYQQGLFNNRIWLQKADGSRFEHNGGFNTTSVSQGKIGFEYLFVDAPGKLADYQLVYETPSRVLTLPLEFTFENVPLP